MTTLTDEDIEKLFSGAPQFVARNDGPFISVPNPSVAFPFDENLQIRDLTDHVQIEAKAWSGVTTWAHITKDISQDAAANQQVEHKNKAHFHVRCHERPNMLSLQGLEKGTMGFQSALELAVSDSLEEGQFGFESIGKKAKAIVDARVNMLSNDGWLHRIPETEILDRLRRDGKLYRANDLRKKGSMETYNDLFRNFMRPRYIAVDKQDHHSLTNQIVALLKCLGAPNVWIDLSHVEWRIRLGQILWGEKHGDVVSDAVTIHNDENASERAEERYWLLLQILVATELLIRLDAVTEGEEYGGGAFKTIDIVQFERAATPTVKWSLLLARSWLENIQIVEEEEKHAAESASEPTVKGKFGWLATLASKISMPHHAPDNQDTAPRHYVIKGRNGERQVDGLLHFAKTLRWPHIDTYEASISEHMYQTLEISPAVEPSPSEPAETESDSYFGTWDVTCQRGHHEQRAQARRRKVAAALNPSGWLSKSYIFGLMLPGDGLSHFLMATLLENDSAAMSKLGSFANLCGGFVYSGMSFWSTACVVGRVLAAGYGTAECMGWISTDIIPDGMSDGWVNIEVQDVRDELTKLGKRSRIWAKRKLERESYILGDSHEETISPADFIVPHENTYTKLPPSVSIELLSFQLAPPTLSLHPTPLTEIIPIPTEEKGSCAPDLPSYPASLSFTISTDGGAEKTHKFCLFYDINFVTAHPCAPSHRVRFLKSPNSPTIQQMDFSGSGQLGQNSRSVYRSGHPLHKFFNFTVFHLSELLQKKQCSLEDLLTARSVEKTPANLVLVIDCMTNMAGVPQSAIRDRLSTPSSSPIAERKASFSAAAKMHFESRDRQFGSDMEILVRAFCAEKGWNAIISRRRRGCLACAIREAGALGWKVVVRVD